jgi:pimeloyl-ACP methyl ester carboxylesterase
MTPGSPRRYVKSLSLRILVLSFSLIGNSSAQPLYPYPVLKVSIPLDDSTGQMAYMDARPMDHPNGKTIVLLHGKNFSGYYWKDVIPGLTEHGYRVVVPDQIGWGHSDKPSIHYSIHLLARNTALLLDSLKINKAIVVGHSMGGMIAARFAMQYPWRTEKLVLENPIGLEDYRLFIPYRTTEEIINNEIKATFAHYKKNHQSYYPAWKPQFEQYLEAQAEFLDAPDFPQIAKVNALTYQMIYEQPVCYEWSRIAAPTLLIIGQEDRTIVGKDLLSAEQQKAYGQYPALGRKTKAQIRKASLVEIPGVGHIPHVQVSDVFLKHLLEFAKE